MNEPTLQLPLSLSPSEASCLLHALERAIDHAAPFAKGKLELVRSKVEGALYGEMPGRQFSAK